MKTTHVCINHMVSARSIMLVKDGLESLGLQVVCISLGEAVIQGQFHQEQRVLLQEYLQSVGLELTGKKRIN